MPYTSVGAWSKAGLINKEDLLDIAAMEDEKAVEGDESVAVY